jgi:hypothetical protein
MYRKSRVNGPSSQHRRQFYRLELTLSPWGGERGPGTYSPLAHPGGPREERSGRGRRFADRTWADRQLAGAQLVWLPGGTDL